MAQERTIQRRHIRLDPEDNVTTLIDGETQMKRLEGGMAVDPGIPFGHKAALEPIALGRPVIKYGVVIGHATADIRPGEHVHVHNCR